MVERLVGAVAEGLRSFGCDVYTEGVYQNLKKPCFFAECESVERIEMLKGRFMVRAKLKIVYDSDSETRYGEIDKRIYEIFSILGGVFVDGQLVHGRSISGKRDDTGFVIRCFYDLQAEEEEVIDYMESLERNGAM